MTTVAKAPVILAVFLETKKFRWFASAIDFRGAFTPLIRSEEGNLATYLNLPFDEQVSFLRHRLSGVLQRAFDRVWKREQKPCVIIFVADGLFAQAAPELTQRVAEHFVEWMTRPPVVFLIHADQAEAAGHDPLQIVAGDFQPEQKRVLLSSLGNLLDAKTTPDLWERVIASEQARE